MKSTIARFGAVFVLSASAMVLACNQSPETPELVTEPGGGPPLDRTCLEQYPKSQTISQPCCSGWGPDACGAVLFCAAFDGRTQTTCYVERSRQKGQSCNADIQCVSGGCNEQVGKCQALAIEECDPLIGCVEGTCMSGRCKPTCTLDSEGFSGTQSCQWFRSNFYLLCREERTPEDQCLCLRRLYRQLTTAAQLYFSALIRCAASSGCEGNHECILQYCGREYQECSAN